jgi:hypothetical protein
MASYSLYGVGGGMLLVAAIGIAGVAEDSHFTPARGEIIRIERRCDFNVTEHEATGRTRMHGESDDCDTTDEFDKLRDKAASGRKTVSGRATVHLSYRSPDGQSRFGEIALTGRDDEFYRWHRGDTVAIKIDQRDPQHIKRG